MFLCYDASMDLTAAGLSDTEASVYTALLTKPEWKPSELAKATGETRTNMYKILDRLVELQLATRFDLHKKLHYRAESPVRLGTLARERKDEVSLQERQLRGNLHSLLKTYYEQHEQPSVRFFQGKEGIKEVFAEQVRLRQPIQFLKTRADIAFFGFEFMHEVRNLAPKAGIKRKVFYPDAPEVPVNTEESDREMLLERVWYDMNDYTAPVEWSVYGDKVSIISFGREAIATVIDSPQVAESLRQIFAMLERGQKSLPNYKSKPSMAEFKDAPSFIQKHKNTLPDTKK